MSIFENRLIDSVTGKLLSTFRMGGLIKFVLSIRFKSILTQIFLINIIVNS